MPEELKQVLREVRDKLLSNPVSPRVEEPADINLHHCRYVAETVADQTPDNINIEILEDGGRGFAHTWLWCDGRHYDAECIDGVDDYRDLPFFQRHPEAAIHVEPGTTDPADLRGRGCEPLYPDVFSSGASERGEPIELPDYWIPGIGGVCVGIFLLLIGITGEWAVHVHLLRQTASLQLLFYDLEVLGEVIAILSPVVFFFLLPSHQERPA